LHVRTIRIPYGSQTISASIPRANYVETISPRLVRPPGDEEALIQAALDHPIGSPRLEELVRPGDRVAVVVDDYTRPTPADRILPHVLDRLHRAGVPKDQVVIVFALGTHRAMTREEMTAKIGRGTAGRYCLVNSSVHDQSEYVYVGTSSLGIPIWILKQAAQADLRVGVGSIVPHCDVGYSGGGKILVPGVCAAQTVALNHIQGLDFRGRNLLGAPTTPIRQDIEDAVARIGLGFIANAVTTADRRLYAMVCGDYVRAQRAGIPFVQDVYGVPARQRADIVVCSAYPGDADFIQVSKAIWSGDKLTHPGGDLIVVTPCHEGVGPYTSLPALMAQDRHEVERRIRGGEIGADIEGVTAALAVRIRRIGERVRIRLVTGGVSPATACEMGIWLHASVEEALDAAFARQGPQASVSVMTHGGYTFPMVAGEALG
jgi:nickel-dependent lactate racemase